MNSSFTNGTDAEDRIDKKIVSEYFYHVNQYLVKFALVLIISFPGMLGNIVNIVVFFRMGVMTDSSNVSLLGLSIADLGAVASLVVYSTMTLVQELNLDLNWDPESMVYIAGGWPHVMFSQMTCWITAYIAFERCICVVFPFKVKTLFSAERSLVVVSCIILLFLSSNLPSFLTQQLQWRMDPLTNRSRLMVIYSPSFKKFENVTHTVKLIFSPTLSMAIVMISTKFTASRVMSSSKWRRTAASTDTTKIETIATDKDSVKKDSKMAANASIQKEAKLIKMIMIICILFIACNLPGITVLHLRKGIPQIRHRGVYHNLFHVLYGVCFFLEAINSSVNIFVYYNLSTRYRQTFRKCFCLKAI